MSTTKIDLSILGSLGRQAKAAVTKGLSKRKEGLAICCNPLSKEALGQGKFLWQGWGLGVLRGAVLPLQS